MEMFFDDTMISLAYLSELVKIGMVVCALAQFNEISQQADRNANFGDAVLIAVLSALTA